MFFNDTQVIGNILGYSVTNVTGNLTISLLLILIVLFAFAFMFGIPIELASVVFLPLVLAYASYYGDFIGPLVAIIFYISIILTKNWILK